MSPPAITHPEAVVGAARPVAVALAARPGRDDFYLTGSAALALYLGHRRVSGLDLMSATNRLSSPDRRDLLADLLVLEPQIKVETARDGYLSTRAAADEAGGGAALRFFYYPYPLAAPLEDLGGLPVASALDLGLMKLGAIISRGTRRDFLDLYLLTQLLPLADLLGAAEDKFGHVRDFPLQALKGLADLPADDPPPAGWPEVEAWVRGPVRELARARVGLDSTEDA